MISAVKTIYDAVFSAKAGKGFAAGVVACALPFFTMPIHNGMTGWDLVHSHASQDILENREYVAIIGKSAVIEHDIGMLRNDKTSAEFRLYLLQQKMDKINEADYLTTDQKIYKLDQLEKRFDKEIERLEDIEKELKDNNSMWRDNIMLALH